MESRRTIESGADQESTVSIVSRGVPSDIRSNRTGKPFPPRYAVSWTRSLADRSLVTDRLLENMERIGGDMDFIDPDPVLMLTLERRGGWTAECELVSWIEKRDLGKWRDWFFKAYEESRQIIENGGTAPRRLLGRHNRNNVRDGWQQPIKIGRFR